MTRRAGPRRPAHRAPHHQGVGRRTTLSGVLREDGQVFLALPVGGS